MAHLHSVYDTDSHFTINPITRVIKNDSSAKTSINQYDHNSERLTFEIPRYVEWHDMSQCNKTEIHWINIDSKDKTKTNDDVYAVTDMQISQDAENEDIVIFSWLISENSTQYAGSLNFMIRFSCVADDGTIDYAWNTKIFTDLYVSNGMYNSEKVVERYSDVLEQWKQELLGIKEEQSVQIEQNASDIDELKGDLSDFKDLADFADSNADSKDTLYIVDTNGKIIAKISKDGIDTVGYKKHGEDFVPGSVDVLETYDDVFYIADGNGNVIFKASKDGIEGVNISASSPSPYKDKVLISIGDSLSAHDKWQKWLVEWWGCTFDDDANVNGKDGHSPMAKGGTAVIPNSVDSIYIRALDAHYYNPDVIILYAGQNDVPHFGSVTEVNSSAVGTIDDVPYKKTVPYTELEESEYSDYTSWYEGRPTLYSYCMGLIENLLTSCPKAQIIVLTPMQMWTSDGTQSVGRKQLVTTWYNICDKYALPIVDLWNKSGVNVFNMIEYYPNAGNVHPNDYGYKRIAETIYSEM